LHMPPITQVTSFCPLKGGLPVFPCIYKLVMWLFIHRQEGYRVTFKPLQCTLSAWAHQLPQIAPVFRHLNYSWSPMWSHRLPSP
jgi:hypothetical protein